MGVFSTLNVLLFGCTALAVNLPRQSNGTGYAVKTPPLDTPWTYQVGTDPWPEYPRPLMERSQWMSLNGVWRHRNESSLDAVNSPPVNQTLENAVLVPSCLESGLSGKWACVNKRWPSTHRSSLDRCAGIVHDLQLVFDLVHGAIGLDWRPCVAQL